MGERFFFLGKMGMGMGKKQEKKKKKGGEGPRTKKELVEAIKR